ncbi:N-6 DNA methylase [Streptomyces solisilvae]|uniref:N-6 DNA methylase n=1 Tax=Streptomyces malaysiensis TaxID=92644 RepID=UPI0036CCDF29
MDQPDSQDEVGAAEHPLRPRRAHGTTAEQLVAHVAESAAAAWHRDRGGVSIEIPLGVVAALAQVTQPAEGPDVSARLLALAPQELLALLERVWSLQWIVHPELVVWAHPLHAWLTSSTPPAETVEAIHATARAAVRAGQLELTGAPDPWDRAQTDLLGRMLEELRSHGAREAMGEHHTPPDVAALFSQFTAREAVDPEPGRWFYEVAAGTGGIFRATAQHLRRRGLNPHDYGWSMVEIDPLAAACCAVNAAVWSLGPNVVIARADVLVTPDAHQQAKAQRCKIRSHRDRVVGQADLVATTHSAATLLNLPTAGNDEKGAP